MCTLQLVQNTLASAEPCIAPALHTIHSPPLIPHRRRRTQFAEAALPPVLTGREMRGASATGFMMVSTCTPSKRSKSMCACLPASASPAWASSAVSLVQRTWHNHHHQGHDERREPGSYRLGNQNPTINYSSPSVIHTGCGGSTRERLCHSVV